MIKKRIKIFKGRCKKEKLKEVWRHKEKQDNL